MSGIEVAGLILGAFPVLLGAIEKNREVIGLVEDWWNVSKLYEADLKKVIAEHSLFITNLGNFLKPILGEDIKLNDFLENPFHEQWDLSSLAEDLKIRLPTAYDSYVDKMQEYFGLMVAFGRMLGIDQMAFQQRIIARDVSITRN